MVLSLRYLDAHEVADRFHRTEAALYVERHRGVGIGALAVKVGRKLLWRESDLERWFDRQRGDEPLDVA